MFLGSSLADVKLNMKYLFLHLFLGFGFFYFLFLFFTYANHRWRKTLQIHFSLWRYFVLHQLQIQPTDVSGNVAYVGVLLCGTDSSMDLCLVRSVSGISSLFQRDILFQLHIIYIYFRSEQIASMEFLVLLNLRRICNDTTFHRPTAVDFYLSVIVNSTC